MISCFLLVLWFRGLSPFLFLLSFPGKGFCSIMICWLLLVPAQVRVVVSLLISSFFFPQTALELNGVLNSC